MNTKLSRKTRAVILLAAVVGVAVEYLDRLYWTVKDKASAYIKADDQRHVDDLRAKAANCHADVEHMQQRLKDVKRELAAAEVAALQADIDAERAAEDFKIIHGGDDTEES